MKSPFRPVFSITLTLVLAICTISLSSWKQPQKKKPAFTDTTRKSKKGNSYYYKKSLTIDVDGNPHEEITENFDGDDELNERLNFNFDFPFLLKDFSVEFPDLPHDYMVPAIPDFEMRGEDFEDRMTERFERLGMQMETMKDRLQDLNFNLDLNLENLTENLNDRLSNLGDILNNDWDNRFDRNFNDENFHSWSDEMETFEYEAKDELVKDGYLREGENIESMSWSDDEIKFNGTPVKPEHIEKYKSLRDKSIGRPKLKGRIE